VPDRTFCGGVNLLNAGFGQRGLQLLLDHRDAGLQRGKLVVPGICAAACAISKWSRTGSSFFNQGGGSELRGFHALARGAFFEILQIGGRAQQPVPVFIGPGRARLEFLDLFRRQPGRDRRNGARQSAARARRFRFLLVFGSAFSCCRVPRQSARGVKLDDFSPTGNPK